MQVEQNNLEPGQNEIFGDAVLDNMNIEFSVSLTWSNVNNSTHGVVSELVLHYVNSLTSLSLNNNK